MNKTKIRIWDKKKRIHHFPVIRSEFFDVERFTGVKDARKVDIYEGDKIICYFQTLKDDWNEMSGKAIGTVKFDNELSQFRVFFKGRRGKMDSLTLEKHHGHVVVK